VNLINSRIESEESMKVISAYSHNDGETNKIFIGDKNKKQCLFCGNEDKGQFKKDAHVLPASLGNRSVFSHEECDICNEKFGETLEQHLANKFTLERAFSRRGGRTGTIKHKPKMQEKLTFIESSSTSETVIISKQIDSDTILTHDNDNNEFSIDVEVPSYKPYYVAQSLARMAMFIMPDEYRATYKHIFNWLNHDAEIKQITYFEVFYPGPGFPFIEASFLESEIEGKTRHTISLNVYSTQLVLLLPLTDGSQSKFFDIPNLVPTPYPPYIPQLTLVTSAEEFEIPKRMDRINIGYTSKRMLVPDEAHDASI